MCSMVHCLKVESAQAERARQKLISLSLFSPKYKPARKDGFVLFPLKEKCEKKAASQGKVVKCTLTLQQTHPHSLSEALAGKLSPSEIAALTKSFDIVGDIAVLEIAPSLAKKEKIIAGAVLAVHRSIRAVAKKSGATAGEFRVRPVKVISGEKRTSTYCRESGCTFHLDINKVYFSGRLSTERLRIASQVKKGEKILALFAGVGPFPIVIEKRAQAMPAKQIAVELNPGACSFLRENILLNKCKTIEVMQGDVAKVLQNRKYSRFADRAIMPLPKSGVEFLASVIPCMRKGGIVHFYSFGPSSAPYAGAKSAAEKIAASCGRKISVLGQRVVRPYSPGVVQTVLDLAIS